MQISQHKTSMINYTCTIMYTLCTMSFKIIMMVSRVRTECTFPLSAVHVSNAYVRTWLHGEGDSSDKQAILAK